VGQYYRLTASANLLTDEDTSNNSRGAFLETYTEPHIPLGYLHTNAT
jgi:hypothetical protein